MEKLVVKIKYPKFWLLILTFILAYFIFYDRDWPILRKILESLGYLGTILAGIFYAYGFTAAPATAVLLVLAKKQPIIIAGLTAGLGALIGDLLIFKFIRISFQDEINKLVRAKIFRHFINRPSFKSKNLLVTILACILIASPLPDEIGVSLLAFATAIPIRKFTLISYALNTGGILIILIIGNLI